jgi:hypothetical protein
MTSAQIRPNQTFQYSDRIVRRAEIALFCSPFKLGLFAAMRNQSVPIPAIASQSGLQENYVKKLMPESKAESELVWLINVGILRREVDGQGLTDSFRLTPLGRQIVAKWESKTDSFPNPKFLERIINAFKRTKYSIFNT